MKLDYLEIGTCDFNCYCQKKKFYKKKGLVVEPLKEYLDRLPNHKNLIKVNMAISDYTGKGEMHYIPREIIQENKDLPHWMKGCNSLNEEHKTVATWSDISRQLMTKIEVDVISFEDLIKKYNIESIGILKIDTEGHDSVILNNYYNVCVKNSNLFAKQIEYEDLSWDHDWQPEHRELTETVMNRFFEYGYKLCGGKRDKVIR